MTIKGYAIRHKPTGEFMPAKMSKNSGRGFSFWEPAAGPIYTAIPRLLDTEKQAKLVLAGWLAGKWEYEWSRSGEYGEEEECYIAPQRPEIERKREDMEIVPLYVTEESRV